MVPAGWPRHLPQTINGRWAKRSACSQGLHVVGIEAVDPEFNVREHRGLDIALKAGGGRRGLLGFGDHEGLALAGFGQPFDQSSD